MKPIQFSGIQVLNQANYPGSSHTSQETEDKVKKAIRFYREKQVPAELFFYVNFMHPDFAGGDYFITQGVLTGKEAKHLALLQEMNHDFEDSSDGVDEEKVIAEEKSAEFICSLADAACYRLQDYLVRYRADCAPDIQAEREANPHDYIGWVPEDDTMEGRPLEAQEGSDRLEQLVREYSSLPDAMGAEEAMARGQLVGTLKALKNAFDKYVEEYSPRPWWQ
jgi:hypothetical protein